MAYPDITAIYAAILALIFGCLSVWVILSRFQLGINHGDGRNEQLNRRIRSHGNFAEYVPLILLLDALLEAKGASSTTMHILLVPLVIARILHPFGMVAREASMQQYICRGGSAVITMLALVVSAGLLLTE